MIVKLVVFVNRSLAYVPDLFPIFLCFKWSITAILKRELQSQTVSPVYSFWNCIPDTTTEFSTLVTHKLNLCEHSYLTQEAFIFVTGVRIEHNPGTRVCRRSCLVSHLQYALTTADIHVGFAFQSFVNGRILSLFQCTAVEKSRNNFHRISFTWIKFLEMTQKAFRQPSRCFARNHFLLTFWV